MKRSLFSTLNRSLPLFPIRFIVYRLFFSIFSYIASLENTYLCFTSKFASTVFLLHLLYKTRKILKMLVRITFFFNKKLSKRSRSLVRCQDPMQHLSPRDVPGTSTERPDVPWTSLGDLCCMGTFYLCN